MKFSKSGLSLIELLVGITITSFILISGFEAISSIGIFKIKIIESTNIEKEAYYAIEKLFDLIKTGGTIDYEEYWNRYSYNTTYSSGHYLNNSGFGNFGNRHYCLSGAGIFMGTGGCLTNFNVDANGNFPNVNYTGQKQMYNQYENQFIDYNGDADGDGGNEDGSTGTELFKGDDDDAFLGGGPGAFPNNTNVSELYLINTAGTERTFLRWDVISDPNAPSGQTCNFTNPQSPTGGGCLGTIQLLKLTGIDEGYDHGAYANNAPGGYWDNDGEIDTWLIQKDFDPIYGSNAFGQSGALAGSGSFNYWQNIFPDTINVSDVEFYLYPNKKLEYSWKDNDPNIQVAPYIRMKMTLQPSWKQKIKIKGTTPSVSINTTIQLSPLDFQ